MTQNERIMKYLIQGNSLDGLTAWKELGCYRLGARISELRKSGINILDRWVDCENQFNEKVKFKEYYISPTERERLIKEQDNEDVKNYGIDGLTKYSKGIKIIKGGSYDKRKEKTDFCSN